MSELDGMSFLDDIIIPDVEDVQEPAEEVLETQDPPADPVEEPEEDEPTEEVIDTSLKGIEADPMDADLPPEEAGEVYGTLAEVLQEKGFFQGEGVVDKIKSADDLAEAFREEIKRNEFSDLTESQRRALEGFRNGIPQAEIVQHEQNLQQYNSITRDVVESNPELQKALFVTDLVNKGISESRAEGLYQIAEDTGELLDEALASLETLKQNENSRYQAMIEQKQAEQEAIARQKAEEQAAIKKSIYAVDKFMDDVKITQNLKEKVHSTMTEIVGYAENGQPLNALMKARQEDPLDFETKLYYLFELTDGFKNLKRFSRQADSKAAKKLESLIQNNTFIKDSNAPTYIQDPDSQDLGGIVSLI